MLGRGVWIPALLSCSGSVLVRVGVRTLMLQVGLAAGACGLEFARAVRSSVRVCCVLLHAARSSAACFLLFCLVLCCTQLVFFHWLRAFMFVMFCVNTRLMSFLISCVFVSCFAHG